MQASVSKRDLREKSQCKFMSEDDGVEEIPPAPGKVPTHRFPDDMPTGSELRGAVPLEVLRELAEGWADGTMPREGTYSRAAQELREVIEEYE